MSTNTNSRLSWYKTFGRYGWGGESDAEGSRSQGWGHNTCPCSYMCIEEEVPVYPHHLFAIVHTTVALYHSMHYKQSNCHHFMVEIMMKQELQIMFRRNTSTLPTIIITSLVWGLVTDAVQLFSTYLAEEKIVDIRQLTIHMSNLEVHHSLLLDNLHLPPLDTPSRWLPQMKPTSRWPLCLGSIWGHLHQQGNGGGANSGVSGARVYTHWKWKFKKCR